MNQVKANVDKGDVLAVLMAARMIITEPEGWTQGVFARDANGLHAWTTSVYAHCFCAAGAVKAVSIEIYDDKYREEVRASCITALADKTGILKPGNPYGFDKLNILAEFNDTHTHQEVLALFDAAIDDCDYQPPTLAQPTTKQAAAPADVIAVPKAADVVTQALS